MPPCPSVQIVWIGCPKMSDGGNVPPEDQPGLIDALQTFSCVPLFLEPELDYQFYFGFCRSYLW